MNQGEIIIYQSAEKPNIQLEVRIEDETVWLTQAPMMELFDSSKQNISLHINNIYKEGELEKHVTVKEYLTFQKEGKRKVISIEHAHNYDVFKKQYFRFN